MQPAESARCELFSVVTEGEEIACSTVTVGELASGAKETEVRVLLSEGCVKYSRFQKRSPIGQENSTRSKCAMASGWAKMTDWIAATALYYSASRLCRWRFRSRERPQAGQTGITLRFPALMVVKGASGVLEQRSCRSLVGHRRVGRFHRRSAVERFDGGLNHSCSHQGPFYWIGRFPSLDRPFNGVNQRIEEVRRGGEARRKREVAPGRNLPRRTAACPRT